MAPTPGDDRIYRNWVFMRVGEGLTFFTIYRYFGDIGKEYSVNNN